MENNLFNSLNVSEEILKAVDDLNYDEMTKIQHQAIPIILQGRDIIGRSSTGTGKTAAFGIPLVEMMKNNDFKNPQALILCPTRELALQVGAEIRKYAKYVHGLSVATIYGGQSMLIQIRQLKRAAVVVGTPGRIMDHMRRNTLKLKDIKTVVLDEADEMLNMGFYDDMKTILSQAPQERQTLLFSATMPKAILKLTDEFLKDPVVVAVDMGKMTLDAIEQYYYQVPQSKKALALKTIIQTNNIKRALVFCNTKKMVDELVRYLNHEGIKSDGLHGDMRQRARTIVMNDYKSGATDILVATDVAARGIDAKGIEAVINYDVPQATEHYIHRIGRTARAGQKGAAYTLVANRNQLYELGEIEEYIKTEIIPKSLPELGSDYENKNEIRVKKEDKFKKDSNKRIDDPSGYISCDKDTGFDNKQNKPKFKGSDRVVLSVNIGRNQKIAPNFIVSAIATGAKISPKVIGKIDIFNQHTNVELSKKDAQAVLDTMKNSTIKDYNVIFKKADSSSKQGQKTKFASSDNNYKKERTLSSAKKRHENKNNTTTKFKSFKKED
jgi:ATP-dependent RNA helicase DeaD